MSWAYSDLGDTEGRYSETFRVDFHPTEKNKLVACGHIGLVRHGGYVLSAVSEYQGLLREEGRGKREKCIHRGAITLSF